MVEYWIVKAGGITEMVANGLTAPIITSATTVAATDGSAFTYQIVATATPELFYCTALPFGLSINHSTGLITGTAHTNSIGKFTLTLQAVNDVGVGTMTLTVLFS